MSWGDFGLSLVSDGLKSAGATAQSWISGLMTNYWNKKSTRDNAAVATEYQKLLSDYNRERDFEMAKRYNEVNLDLAQRYSENAAKWTTTGLRNAGLNPILAAGGSGVGSAQMGTSTPSVSGGSNFSPVGSGFRADVAEAARDLGSLGLQDATAKQLSAQTSNVEAQTRLQDLNTAKEAYTLLQEVLKEGEKGPFGWLLKGSKLLDPTDNRSRKAAERITENVGRVVEGSLERALGLPSSASDSSAHGNNAILSPDNVKKSAGTVLDSSAKPHSKPAPHGWSRRTRTSGRKPRAPVLHPFSGPIIVTP